MWKNVMRASLLLIQMVMEEEGLSLVPYADGAGKKTIGYGHLLSLPHVPEKITPQKATLWLLEDIYEAEDAVRRQVKVPLTQQQFDALVDFTFNFGEDKLKNSGMLKELNQLRYSEAAKRMLLWNKIQLPNGEYEVSKGLKHRRQREVNIFERGDYADTRLSS